ncbi:hypothetical protein FHS09_002928 [Microbulbifer rhizosphaerae]|uniref:Uncharacterized protein n=1 Tax=Microbulbifer rhizosphaerae TaxID=1562603 RepID=A0A7W4ZB67_9GAMM|nr:hypothetical protein [Microbulbifer rhizosphaerae]
MPLLWERPMAAIGIYYEGRSIAAMGRSYNRLIDFAHSALVGTCGQ